MNNPKFPEWIKYKCRGFTEDWTWIISKLELDDWFIRMIEDFPDRTQMGGKEAYDIWSVEEWFDKWLSQFTVKDEEVSE